MGATPLLPPGLEHVRTTPTFTPESTPAGLRSAHQLAPEVWGRLVVHTGEVTFVLEDSGEGRVVAAGEDQVIEPEVRHHVEPGPGSTFAVEFHR